MTHDEYLHRVEAALRDLPWKQRRGLAAELREHLAELPAETDLYERLGPPERYAADLRAAEGLERRRGPVAYVRARRPRTVLLVALALTLLGLALGGGAWVDSYQPITRGTAHFAYPRLRGGGVSSLLNFLAQRTRSAYVRDGKPVQIAVSITNSGPVAVRVTGLPTLLQVVPARGSLYVAGRPFHPFDLAAGKTAQIVFRGRYTTSMCRREGPTALTVRLLTGFRVDFDFLWRSGSAQIKLPQPLAFNFPRGDRCPGTVVP